MAQKIHTTTTGDVSGNTLGYSFDFPSLSQDDIRVSVAGSLKELTTDYTIGQWTATGSTSNFIQFVNSDKRGTGTVRIFRETSKTGPKASFTSGSAIKADDLNINQKQSIYIAEEFEDDMTNLAANNATGFQINGSNIADNSITTTKIAGLNVQESDIDNDAVTANKLKSSSSTDSDRAVTTNHIRDGAVTDAKIAGVAGSKVVPNFGNQNIVTTGTLGSNDITITGPFPTLNFTDSGENPDYSIKNLNGNFGLVDTTNSTVKFLVNSSDGHVDLPSHVDIGSGLDVTGTCTATTFSGSGANLTNLASSALTGALPAIDGSNLTGINLSSIKRVKYDSNRTFTRMPASSSFQTHLTVAMNNVDSGSKFLIIAGAKISIEFSSTAYAIARVECTNGQLTMNNEMSNALAANKEAAFPVFFNDLDQASNGNNRTYRLQIRSTSSASNRQCEIDDAFLIVVEFTPS